MIGPSVTLSDFHSVGISGLSQRQWDMECHIFSKTMIGEKVGWVGFGYIEVLPDTFGYFEALLGTFRYFQILPCTFKYF